MSSIVEQLQEQEEYLRDINNGIKLTITKINKDSLLNDVQFTKKFQEVSSPESSSTVDPISKLSISQLNHKYESISKDIKQLESLVKINGQLKEIESYLEKPKTLQSLLDLQQLSTLLRNIDVDSNSSLIIHKQISKRIEMLKSNFLTQLNDYLSVLLIPDYCTILNVSILHEFNSFVLKNDYSLDCYSLYKTKWDNLIDLILDKSQKVDLVYDEYEDSMVMSVTESTSKYFIKSITNLIKFINELEYPIIKNFINSKISKNLVNKISSNINDIIKDQTQMNDLNELLEFCHANNWNVLSRIEGNGSIKEKLNKLYLDWIVDNYIEEIRQVFKSDAIAQRETIDFDSSGKVEEPSPAKQEEETDAWDDNWDDDWDVEEEEEEEAGQNDVKKDSTKKSAEEDQITISSIPNKLLSCINDFQKHSQDLSYLVSTIQALAIVEYPSLANSFLMFNDFSYLSSKVPSEYSREFQQFINCNWNQVLIKFYSELKIILMSLNLENDSEVQRDPDELDDYNLNQLSLIYKWFNILFEEKQLKSTNITKFTSLVIELIQFVNTWLIQMVLNLEDISEQQTYKINQIIENINNVTIPYLQLLGIQKDTSIESYNKLKNVQFLLNNHLKDIIERFYEGEFYDLETQELVQLIKAVFLQSEMRDNYINEIIEFRNMN
ncbi:conserved hypothetical protein [Candida tropicalis MYA-3404]|uniref:Retrograde transport protein Dsl1 C-terminal domain-containing protein n=1 Tax=Candida tropicalis (strain ATCC MYA-3404 / T1) TaxID=294747 RepID=C5M3Q9_CANTT|nr:conserved hypothetical protein [Candida tropicalis MYA-3404]EER35959.1 conserved hypothetical protein [Candida tropicalis MYA-3404]KAG4410077.1 hypothetical protein JTP64_000715 [Candida tropicalis]